MGSHGEGASSRPAATTARIGTPQRQSPLDADRTRRLAATCARARSGERGDANRCRGQILIETATASRPKAR
jgi:hypothetical protein